MRQILTKFCYSGYHLLALYGLLRKIIDSKGDCNKTLFEEMLYRIETGKYGQDSERELMALKYNITVRLLTIDSLYVFGAIFAINSSILIPTLAIADPYMSFL